MGNFPFFGGKKWEISQERARFFLEIKKNKKNMVN